MKLKERLINSKIAIHCKTFDEAKQLFKILDSWDIKWMDNKHIFQHDRTGSYLYEEETCYDLDKDEINLCLGYRAFYKLNKYEIWSFEKFVEEYNKENEMTNKELIQQIRSGKGVSINDIERMSQTTRNNDNVKTFENILQEFFGDNIKFDIISLDDITENAKNVVKDIYTDSGLESLLNDIKKANVKQDNTEETNKTSNDEYFFKELETAKKAILEAKTLDKKTILFSKERERLQGAILDYCHKKDWSSTIEFTLSEEILNTNLRNEFLKSVCEEFGLTFLSSSKTRNCQDVEFELKTN